MSELDYIGEYIYDYRRTRGLSMDQLAEKADLSKSMISQIESGKVNPTINALNKIAKAMEIELAALVDPTNKPMKYIRSYLGESKATFSKDRSFMCHQLNLKSRYKSLRIDHFEFKKKGEMLSKGHANNTIEYIIVEKGTLTLEFMGKSFTIGAGEIFEFRADSKHVYRQTTKDLSKGIIVMYHL